MLDRSMKAVKPAMLRPMTLAHTRMSSDPLAGGRSRADTTVVFLHGIFGRGANWETFARKLIKARPELDAVLVDLRMHGESQGLPPPHTLRSAAADVRELLGVLGDARYALVGHSFGGKVALQVLADEAGSTPNVREAWVLDASPSSRPMRTENDVTRRVLDALLSAPPRFPTRAAFVAELQGKGVLPTLGQWLSKNLVRDAEGLRLMLDLQAVRDLLIDHDRSDLWSAVETGADVVLHYVLGGQSTTVSPEDRARLSRATALRPLELHELPTAGHWVHVDDPEGLMRALVARLGAGPE